MVKDVADGDFSVIARITWEVIIMLTDQQVLIYKVGSRIYDASRRY